MTGLQQVSLLLAGLLALTNAQQNVRGLAGPQRVSMKDAWALEDPATAVTEEGGDELGPDGGRIIGGVDVQPGSIPFYGHFEGDVMCGGCLVTSNIFITAAHCLEKGYPSRVKIGATTTISQNEGESVPVCAAMIHEANNMKSMENDLAILQLCDEVFVTSYCEYNRDPTYPSATGTDLFMVGFGRTNIEGSLSPILQTAKVDFLDNTACGGRYDRYNGDQVLCADSPTSEAGICYGDSGGPLLDSKNLVVGLNSYIVETCASSYPDFFTRLSSYSDWLDYWVCELSMTKPGWCKGGSSTGGSGGGGDPAQGDDEPEDDDDAGGNPTDALTECLTLLIGFFQSFLGGR